MADLRRQRIMLLRKLAESDVDWKTDDESIAPGYPNDPPADFYVQFNNLVVDLGKAVRKTDTGPRQQYFIRIVRDTTLVDLFFENDVPLAFKDLFRPIYEKASNTAIGVNDAYDFIFNSLD